MNKAIRMNHHVRCRLQRHESIRGVMNKSICMNRRMQMAHDQKPSPHIAIHLKARAAIAHGSHDTHKIV
jgi:hypothetical protein